MTRSAGNLRGAALMALCMVGYASNDACMRAIAGDLPAAQAITLRGALTTIFLAALYFRPRFRGPIPRGRDLRLITQRSLAEAVTGVAVVVSVFHMELATFTSIMQAGPLSIALAGALWMGEPVGWRRLSAILVGFAGVLVIIRPGTEGFNIWSLSALAAVAAFTVRDLSARRISSAVSPVLPALAGSVMVTILASFWSLGVAWVPLSIGPILAIVGGAVLLSLAYVLSIEAMRTGEIGFVVPFRYAGLLWALFIGWTLLGEWPDIWTLVGGAIVVASGGYMLWRELPLSARLRKRV